MRRLVGKAATICGLCVVGNLTGWFPAFGDDGRFPLLGGRPLVPARSTAGCGVNYADFVRRSGLTSARDAIDLARL